MCLETQEAVGELNVPSSEDGVNQQINKDLSEALTLGEEKNEINEEDSNEEYIETLASGRIDICSREFRNFLGRYGYQYWQKVSIEEFEENFEEFKMSSPMSSSIIY